MLHPDIVSIQIWHLHSRHIAAVITVGFRFESHREAYKTYVAISGHNHYTDSSEHYKFSRESSGEMHYSSPRAHALEVKKRGKYKPENRKIREKSGQIIRTNGSLITALTLVWFYLIYYKFRKQKEQCNLMIIAIVCAGIFSFYMNVNRICNIYKLSGLSGYFRH